ncbi:MAG: hypothetical protein KatS3mg101_1168 [Patescibacteria group bacterium]|nr:MAG: hypothetical protein KatS3mg101_1168 [Patescibacteria group bacterium]
MNYLKKLEQEAEKYFSNYSGDPYEYEFEQYNNYEGNKKLTFAETSFVINVNNTGTTDEDVSIFGAYKNLFKPNFGLPANVTVGCEEVEYTQLLQQVSTNPLLVKGIKFLTDNPNQVRNTLIFEREDIGSSEKSTLQPLRFRSVNQQRDNEIDLPGIKFPLDGKVTLRTKVLSNTSLTLIFFVAAKADLSLAVIGQNPIKSV